MRTREDPNPHHCKKGSFDPNRYRTDGWISDFARNRIKGIGTRYGYSVDYGIRCRRTQDTVLSLFVFIYKIVMHV